MSKKRLLGIFAGLATVTIMVLGIRAEHSWKESSYNDEDPIQAFLKGHSDRLDSFDLR